MELEYEIDIKYPIHIGPVFLCELCNMNFINLVFLEKHQEKCLNTQINSFLKNKMIIKISQKERNKKLSLGKKIFACKVCKKNCKSSQILKNHLQNHENIYECFLCKKISPDLNTHKGHIAIHKVNNKFKCDICNKMFVHTGPLKKHIQIHSYGNPSVNRQIEKSSKKKEKRKMFKYDEEQMRKAIDAVKKGMSKSKASQLFNVPRSTLIYKSSGKYPIERRMGPSCFLGKHNEDLLAQWIIQNQTKGLPINRVQLIENVSKMVLNLKLKTPFKNGKPGRKWIELFLQRHPEIDRIVRLT